MEFLIIFFIRTIICAKLPDDDFSNTNNNLFQLSTILKLNNKINYLNKYSFNLTQLSNQNSLQEIKFIRYSKDLL